MTARPCRLCQRPTKAPGGICDRHPGQGQGRRLKWARRAPGRYYAGPWTVKRYPYHRPLWELRRWLPGQATDAHVGNFDTAAAAKWHAQELQDQAPGKDLTTS